MILTKIIQVFKNEKNIPFFSFLFGLGIAVMLFHKPFETKTTLGLPVSEIEKQVVKIDNKCYSYNAEDSQCEILPSK